LDSLLHEIVRLLLEQGPWLVFAVSLAETALFAGLVLPAEATVIVAAFLADRHYFEVWQVFAASWRSLADHVGRTALVAASIALLIACIMSVRALRSQRRRRV
jgi:hypothetical protein